MTVDRRAASALVALADDDLRETLVWIVEGLPALERRRLLDCLRTRDRRQHADPTTTARRPNADATPTESPSATAPAAARRQNADGTTTERRQNDDKGSNPSKISSSSLPLDLGEPLQDPVPPVARARPLAPVAELDDGGHPEDADDRVFARAVNAAYEAAQRPGVPFPRGHVGYRDKQRLREAWPRIHSAAVAASEAVGPYIARALGAFVAGSHRATWLLWIQDPTVGAASGSAPPAPHEAFTADTSDEGVAEAVGAK